eukprot:GHVP01057669.1.p1 GENE.GHVP01057669.1~~GHVP01057669.1.p1  ORF type:complete len:132 (-),score=10.57 GHVP01057669.1:520-915(-)
MIITADPLPELQGLPKIHKDPLKPPKFNVLSRSLYSHLRPRSQTNLGKLNIEPGLVLQEHDGFPKETPSGPQVALLAIHEVAYQTLEEFIRLFSKLYDGRPVELRQKWSLIFSEINYKSLLSQQQETGNLP